MEKDEPVYMTLCIVGTFVVILLLVGFCMTQLLSCCTMAIHSVENHEGKVLIIDKTGTSHRKRETK